VGDARAKAVPMGRLVGAHGDSAAFTAAERGAVGLGCPDWCRVHTLGCFMEEIREIRCEHFGASLVPLARKGMISMVLVTG
jgi:hypothetical protein